MSTDAPVAPGSSRHPDDAALRAWLDTGGPRSVDDHVGVCEACAARLEQMAGDDGGEVLDGLAAVTAPPPDLTGRTTVRVRDRLAAQESMSVLLELLSLPLRTASVLLGGEAPSRRGITGSNGRSDETAGDDGE